MLAEGGVYSDMDTSCIKQIDKWIPQHLRDEEINAVVGIEYDDNTYPMFVRPISFCQWTLMSKPNHPLFEAVVARVIYHLEYLARIQNTSLSGLKVNKKEVLEATGPGAFTDAVIETLRNGIGKRVDWKDVSGLKEPTMFGDVLVLPIRSFGSGQKHSHSNDEEYGEALAKHHFGRSWYVRPGPDPKADEHPPMPTEEKAEVIPFPVPNENGEENAEESPEEPSTPMSKLKGDNGDDDAKDPMHPLSAERTPPDA
jgi:mannosyltransferase OCH1-like enzyme